MSLSLSLTNVMWSAHLDGVRAQTGVNLTAMNLLPNEVIIYRTRMHWVVLIAPVLILLPLFAFCGLWGLFFLIGGIQEFDVGIIVGGILYLLPPSFLISVGIRQMRSAKFVVTNKRVILNSGKGVLKHHEAEIPLGEIQSIVIQPSRFAYPESSFGTIVVIGKTGSAESFRCVSQPQAFRDKLEEQIARFAAERQPTTS